MRVGVGVGGCESERKREEWEGGGGWRVKEKEGEQWALTNWGNQALDTTLHHTCYIQCYV